MARVDAAHLAAVLPLAAAALYHQRQAARPDPSLVAWQAMPLRVRCLLESGASAWLVDRVHDLARDLALHNAISGMSESESLTRICDAVWQMEVERHQPGISRDKLQRAAERYIALLRGIDPCPHEDAEHAQPSELIIGPWRCFVERSGLEVVYARA
jgi:hypothetical protein